MDQVTMARPFFGTSLAFHIIYATLGIGLSAMVFVSEWLFYKRKDLHYAVMAKRWTKSVALLLGAGLFRAGPLWLSSFRCCGRDL